MKVAIALVLCSLLIIGEAATIFRTLPELLDEKLQEFKEMTTKEYQRSDVPDELNDHQLQPYKSPALPGGFDTEENEIEEMPSDSGDLNFDLDREIAWMLQHYDFATK